MSEEIIIAGFGGQGILFAGKVLCLTGMSQGLRVTYLPAYGAEVRGGTAHCHIVLSDEEIASPAISRPTVLLALNEPSLKKFENKIAEAGLLIFNSSLVAAPPRRADIKVLAVPATEMANDLGNAKSANMVIVGSFLAYKKILEKDFLLKAIADLLIPGRELLRDINIKAVSAGYQYAAAAVKKNEETPLVNPAR